MVASTIVEADDILLVWDTDKNLIIVCVVVCSSCAGKEQF
jgi:hypothetical protein